MDQTIFLQLSLVLAVAASVSIIMRVLRQPLIIGYILSGIICGPSLLNAVHNHAAFASFSQIGIALLLFIVGLGLNVAVIRSTGKPVLLVFLTNLLVVGGVGYGLGHLFRFSNEESILVGLGLLFSSTIVVIKSLTDKRENTRLYGQIIVGVLLVEDIVATIALLFVATAKDGGSTHQLELLAGKGVLLALGLVIVGAYILPKMAKFFASSQELLFTFALAWAFSIASLFKLAGFSIEVGALFAGVSLASLPYAQEISTRLKPLRDFFLLLFFIGLGEQLNFGNLRQAIIPALVFSAVAIVLKPIAVSTALGTLGYTKQTGFKTAVHLSQISEFSIILVALAVSSGIANSKLADIFTLTAMITIAVSTYLMKYDNQLYPALEKTLSIFERKNAKRDARQTPGYRLVLFGYHKGGHEFVNTFRDMRGRYVVVDYNPEVIEIMERQGIHHIYGDASDFELLEEIGIDKAELIVSTIPDYTINSQLVKHILATNSDAIFICHANDLDDAEKLYEHGVAYVMLPHFIGSEHMSHFIRRNGSNKAAFDAYRKRHLISLGKVATLA